MSDADLKAKWEKITDPREALLEMVTHSYFIGTDPYYADMNEALWKMAERTIVETMATSPVATNTKPEK